MWEGKLRGDVKNSICLLPLLDSLSGSSSALDFSGPQPWLHVKITWSVLIPIKPISGVGMEMPRFKFPRLRRVEVENLHYSFFFFLIFKLYIIVLVLPNIKMNPPQVYMCSPS